MLQTRPVNPKIQTLKDWPRTGTHGMEVGRAYQFRTTGRDVVTAHNTRCKNISFRDCDFHAMTGMGIVSQSTDGVTFERVRVAPEKGTQRTCPAWADMLHFSGCRGQILVNECVFSGSQDDPINVHGTHLRIIGKPADNQLLLRFSSRTMPKTGSSLIPSAP